MHQQLEAHKESFEATEKLQKERFFEVERLRELKQQCYDKLQQAEDDEKAASAAAETAIRLAENAVKIRETISSENSGLLLQAQQVLMEAAESAQQLKDEKNIFKQSVQIEYDDIFAQVESAEKMAEDDTKQKNQLETILLHMTDGIIAFDMSGDIILINPAAKKFLSIRPEDNTFDDIFKNST